MSFKSFFFVVWFIPLCIIGGFNFIVDPYNVNCVFDFGLNKTIADDENHRIWKLAKFYNSKEYSNHMKQNLILGDSRGRRIDAKKIEEITGEIYTNLAYGGGTAYEMVDTFWHVVSQVPLQRVYFCMNFNLYNQYNHMNLVPEAINILSDPTHYYYSHFVSKTSWKLVSDKLERVAHAAKPSMTREEFWEHQLNVSAKGFYGRYKYPEDLYLHLLKIRSYCEANNIEMVFIIPPTHTDLQARIRDFGLEKEEARFKDDLRHLGVVYDFDIDVPQNRNKENYADPFHAKANVFDEVIETVWRGKEAKDVRILSCVQDRCRE